MYPPNQFGYQFVARTPDPQYLKRIQEESVLRREANRVGLTVLCYYGLMFAIQMLLVGLITAWGLMDYSQVSNPYQGIEPLAYYLMYGVCATISAILPGFLLIRISQSSIHQMLPFARVGGKKTLGYVAMGLGVCMFANLAGSMLDRNLQWIGVPSYSPPTPYDGSPLSMIMLVLCICVVPALMEEFVFRGAVLGSLRKFGDGVAVLGSAALFGLIHGNLVQIPFAFVVGLILGYLVVHTGSMLPGILLHFANNLFSCLLVMASEGLQPEAYNILAYASMLLLLALGAVGLLYLCKRDPGLFTVSKTESSLRFSRRLGILAGSPAVIAFIVVVAIMSFITMLGAMLL
ncbi:MAG: CPBP family intramembrane metalloprotease [Clostridiales bacterium]|jgi:membrane protease YdiL (CAAX protease family)|nr:CPBP family intramembrane metalloprotease [Clostridiales bacterium]